MQVLLNAGYSLLEHRLCGNPLLLAAESGNLEVLQYARANGCPWDHGTCAGAAKGNHLEVLQWAHANNCPWDEMTCTNAARGGYLNVLKYARGNGCPWDESVLHYATANDDEEMVVAWPQW